MLSVTLDKNRLHIHLQMNSSLLKNKIKYYEEQQCFVASHNFIHYQQKYSIIHISNMKESQPINLHKLKELIHYGTQIITVDQNVSQAVLVIGDTGVGKSTIMSFLSGNNLVVRCEGLKPTLDNPGQSNIKIGHQKYSQTSVPTKVIIQDMAFYDCPGFKDNKGEQYQISNSFFVQRLLDIYNDVKLVLIIDQSHISQSRADKLPKLIRNLHECFTTFEDIKEGVTIIINRAALDQTMDDYHREIRKMIELKNENICLFSQQESDFMESLMTKNRILLFRQAQKGKDNFEGQNEKGILTTIKQMEFVKCRHIQNILSKSAKLAIRDFIDDITNSPNNKIQTLCAEIVKIYWSKIESLNDDINGIVKFKTEVVCLAEEVKTSNEDSILLILQRELPKAKTQDFQEDFASIMFFKNIYDKTSLYFSNIVNKVGSQLSHLHIQIDKHIVNIQRQQVKMAKSMEKEKEDKLRLEKREQEKIVALEDCSRMNELKVTVQKICVQQKGYIDQIIEAMKKVSAMLLKLNTLKVETTSLSSHILQYESEFYQIQISQA